jgi:hypothetical protein
MKNPSQAVVRESVPAASKAASKKGKATRNGNKTTNDAIWFD